MLKAILKTENDYAALVLRILLAAVFFPHGAQKVLGWFGGHGLAGTYGHFTQNMGIPPLFAALAIAAEFLGPLALAAGLLTRIAALGIGSVMVVATTVHFKNGFFMNWFGAKQGEGYEFHLLAIAIALALVIKGGGALSLDRRLTERGGP